MEFQRFLWIAIFITILILIISLVFVGLLMSGAGSSATYPSVSNTCPDYWIEGNKPGICVIPDPTTRNGIELSELSGTPGFSETTRTIDFNNAGWATGSSSEICAKQTWSNLKKILWDGITNYNGC